MICRMTCYPCLKSEGQDLRIPLRTLSHRQAFEIGSNSRWTRYNNITSGVQAVGISNLLESMKMSRPTTKPVISLSPPV